MDSRSRVPAISVETKRFPGEKQEPRELLTWIPVVEFRRDCFSQDFQRFQMKLRDLLTWIPVVDFR